MVRRLLVFCNLALLIAAFALSGCSQYFYTPTNQQVMNFTEKGDAAINLAVDGNEGSGISMGYAITNHVALSSGFMGFSKDTNGKYRNDSYMWDNELIVFNKREADKGYFIQAINLGYGLGEIGRNASYYGVNISRMFAQPSIGYRVKGFEFAASLRLSSVKYDIRPAYAWDTFNSNGRTLEETFNMPHDNGRYFFAEPALTIGYGYRAFRVRLQRSWASKTFEDDFEYINNNLTLSLNVNVNAIRLFNKE